MADELIVTRVQSQTIGQRGRSLSTARTNHFVIDEPAYNGGPGEAVTPAEAFLSGVSACGVLLVESFASQRGVPLRKVNAEIEGNRLPSDPSRFLNVRLRFELDGPTQQQAEELVALYQGR